MFSTSPSARRTSCLPASAVPDGGPRRRRAGGDEVVPADHLAADEAMRDVGVDRGRGGQRRLAAAQCPRPRSFPPAVKNVITSSVSARRSQRPCRSADRRWRPPPPPQLGQLRLQLEVDPVRLRVRCAVLDRDQRLRGQRLELAGSSSPQSASASPASRCASSRSSCSTSSRSVGSPDFGGLRSRAPGAARRGRGRRRAARASASEIVGRHPRAGELSVTTSSVST